MNWIQRILGKSLISRIEALEVQVNELTNDRDALVQEMSEMPAYCDKCEGSPTCLKCAGTGIVKKKQLFTWRW